MALSAAAAVRFDRTEIPFQQDRHRETLVRRFADLLFLPPGQASPFEKGLVDEILSRLYPSLDYGVRLRLSQRLSQLAEPPRRLVRLMAADRPEIARLFLERVELLVEAELVALIASTGIEHHAMIAGRPGLSSAVTDAIIAVADSEIIEVLIENRSAVFSAHAYQRLAELSRGNAAYQERLLMRTDLPASLAHEMFWWVGAPLRRAILQRYSMERRLLVAAFADLEVTLSAAPADVYWAFRLCGAARPRIKAEADDVARLAAWLAEPSDKGLGEELANTLVLRPVTIALVVKDGGGEPLAVLCKALGLSASQFRTLLPYIAPRPARMDELAALFDTLSTDWADLVLRLWDQQEPAGLSRS